MQRARVEREGAMHKLKLCSCTQKYMLGVFAPYFKKSGTGGLALPRGRLAPRLRALVDLSSASQKEASDPMVG